MTALLLALALAADPAAPTALGRAALQAATQALDDVPQGRLVGVWVQASTPELGQAAGSLLVDAARRKGAKAAMVIDATDGAAAEAKAREAGIDVLLRVRAGLEGPDLTLAGDRIGTWVNFWDGKTPVRQLASAPISVRTVADASALTLARVVLPTATPPASPLHFGVDALARVPARVVALALVDADGDGRPELAALTTTELLVMRPDGEVLARRDHSQLPEAAHAVRAPSGGLVAPEGPKGKRLAYAYAGRARGELVLVDRSGLHPIGLLDGVPLCTGPGGTVSALNQAGTNLYGPEVKLGSAAHTLSRAVVGLAANPRSGGAAYLALYADGQVQPLTPTLADEGAPIPGVGTATLADLDGDGQPELVASSAAPEGASDQVRILRLGAAQPAFTSEAISGAIVAATAGDLDGDGKDEALLAALQPDGTTAILRVGVKP